MVLLQIEGYSMSVWEDEWERIRLLIDIMIEQHHAGDLVNWQAPFLLQWSPFFGRCHFGRSYPASIPDF